MKPVKPKTINRRKNYHDEGSETEVIVQFHLHLTVGVPFTPK
jgi:hypothetical protein